VILNGPKTTQDWVMLTDPLATLNYSMLNDGFAYPYLSTSMSVDDRVAFSKAANAAVSNGGKGLFYPSSWVGEPSECICPPSNTTMATAPNAKSPSAIAVVAPISGTRPVMPLLLRRGLQMSGTLSLPSGLSTWIANHSQYDNPLTYGGANWLLHQVFSLYKGVAILAHDPFDMVFLDAG
jgi:hypothetical protein